ncbi:alpha/beta hydrolase [Azoarcus sp. L1K30]|uniref:alpha/beta fold hydrolase n=1 Tax=Azoarcus sp. L1K30 TaxID=2820277 RepID=UPI001B81D845|nr:alpha/beta hydrolase [Azoarcus sp. L1K30]MBR0565999.1 alpha/beta hydrolase [Azoarcus sp. L1K30]
MQLQAWYHSCSAGYTLRGEHSLPSGKPVLHFLHGNGYCGRTYEPMLARLAPHFDLFLSDVQGHGDSDHGGRFHGWNRTAELCLEAWRARGQIFRNAPVFAVGHSFGGVITSLMLAKAPTQFARAVLLDPVLFPPAMIGLMALSDVVGLYSRNTLASRTRKRRHHWPDRQSAFASLQGRGMFKGWKEEALWAYVNHALRNVADGGVELKCKPAREAEIFSSYPRRLWSSLEKIRTPTLVLRGEDTYPFAIKGIERWCASNDAVSQRVMQGGHCFMQEDPAATAAAITDFLSAG